MRVLFIGGTGTISMAITRRLLTEGHKVYLLNRGTRNGELPPGAIGLTGDIEDEEQIGRLTEGMKFDVVADFIAFVPEHVERDYRMFKGRTGQYIFISSASAYQKPPSDYRMTEGTPLANPKWQYSRDKIACEAFLMEKYREEGFPVTIVRPSHTYDERSIPMGLHGENGSYQVVKRIKEGKPVLIPGDGTSLWTVTHNSDFAKGFVGLMGNIHAIGEAVQITSDETLTWNQIYQTVADALGVPLHPVRVSSDFLDACSDYDFNGSMMGDKSNSVVFLNDKLKRLVPGFTAVKRFDQGVRESLAYIASHPECQKEDPEFDAFCDRVVEALERAKDYVRKGIS